MIKQGQLAVMMERINSDIHSGSDSHMFKFRRGEVTHYTSTSHYDLNDTDFIINPTMNGKPMNMESQYKVYAILNNIREIKRYYKSNKDISKVKNIGLIHNIQNIIMLPNYTEIIDITPRKKIIKCTRLSEIKGLLDISVLREFATKIGRMADEIFVINIEISELLNVPELKHIDLCEVYDRYLLDLENDKATAICLNYEGEHMNYLESVKVGRTEYFRVKDDKLVQDIMSEYVEAYQVMSELSMNLVVS